MSEQFDPIEEWLGQDVDLLPPRPGTFERVHRRARRRKATVAMSAAAGVAVVVVAAAVLPGIASALLPGNGGNQANVSGVPSSHHVSPKPHGSRQTQSPAPSPPGPSPSGPPYLAGSGQSISGSGSGSGSPAAREFAPSSVTFVSQTAGAALGTTSAGCHVSACTTLAGTSDYGATWTKADAPPAGPPDGDTGVSQLRFLDPQHGWAYGPELFATQDGGATWTRIRLPGRVVDLETVGAAAFAVVASCQGGGPSFAAGCTSFTLYSAPFDSTDWQPVTGAQAHSPVNAGGLQLTSASGYLLAGSALFTGPPAGGAWQRVTVSSGPVPACLDGKGHTADAGASGLITPDRSGVLYLLCQDESGRAPALYQSSDSGRTWKLTGRPAIKGTASSMAVGSATSALVVATTSGIFYSADTQTWHRAELDRRAPGGFSYVGMTTATQGVAVPADPGLNRVFFTPDGGKTWQARAI